jgi:hypothetical protein
MRAFKSMRPAPCARQTARQINRPENGTHVLARPLGASSARARAPHVAHLRARARFQWALQCALQQRTLDGLLEASHCCMHCAVLHWRATSRARYSAHFEVSHCSATRSGH